VLRRRPSRARDAGHADRPALIVDEAGDPRGFPVVYLHGGGDSRLSRHPDDSIAASLGVRLLALDRSGPAARHRTLRGWAEHVAELLPAKRPFAAVGWSAGGPHALALAAVAPERVRRVALVGSTPPPDGIEGLPNDVRWAIRVARVAPRLAQRSLERWGRRPTPPTGDPLTDDAYARGRVEAFRSGGLWLARELAYLGRPWGFELADVRAPVTLWCGERDRICPPAMARDYLRRLPQATLRVVDDGHQFLFSRWREILADVAGREA
jgi:pimeloyl-ACP methyl ester carboxylesterase